MAKIICTLIFLEKDNKVLLALGKKGVNKGKLNGYGGKVDPEDAGLREAGVRELAEEAGIEAQPEDLEDKGMVSFVYTDEFADIGVAGTKEIDVYMFGLKKWKGEPTESAEMGEPEWFAFDEIPYERMLFDQRYWFPYYLKGRVEGSITITPDHKLVSHTFG